MMHRKSTRDGAYKGTLMQWKELSMDLNVHSITAESPQCECVCECPCLCFVFVRVSVECSVECLYSLLQKNKTSADAH